MSGETETVAGALTPAQQLFNQAVELEKQLRSVIQLKGPLDPNVWDLHSNIRENYETIIFEDHQFAEVHDVEQVLWRFHYKQIEEFRNRIRKSMGATAAAATSPMPGSKCLKEKETVNKLLVTFKGFLSEATGFYHELILKLRTRHGLPQDPLSTEGIDFASDKKGAAELKRCQLSCHRCLIYLGDLARYKELHGDADTRNHDWSVAAGYYLKAIFLWPASGNPHNQLAVLAMYVGDELLAVYRYFRSLAVETAFLTARDNLILLFEKLADKPREIGMVILLLLPTESHSEVYGEIDGEVGDKFTSKSSGRSLSKLLNSGRTLASPVLDCYTAKFAKFVKSKEDATVSLFGRMMYDTIGRSGEGHIGKRMPKDLCVR
eukprot:Gb_30018 [translate_table: standard]